MATEEKSERSEHEGEQLLPRWWGLHDKDLSLASGNSMIPAPVRKTVGTSVLKPQRNEHCQQPVSLEENQDPRENYSLRQQIDFSLMSS